MVCRGLIAVSVVRPYISVFQDVKVNWPCEGSRQKTERNARWIAANADIYECVVLRSKLQDNSRYLVSVRIKCIVSWKVVDPE